jgi:hypothetical protein
MPQLCLSEVLSLRAINLRLADEQVTYLSRFQLAPATVTLLVPIAAPVRHNWQA